MLTPRMLEAAERRHLTYYFDADLRPVVPRPGQRFCEFDTLDVLDDDAEVFGGEIVEYIGEGFVESGDGDERKPRGYLILQGRA